MAKATFGGGCFWGVEAAFRQLEGVTGTAAGYSGGDFKNPSYEDVCSGMTGHAEVTRVDYDPERLSYERLLDVFWQIHDPTTPDRQGPDVGTQYRSVVFYHTKEQGQAARASLERLEKNGKWKNPVVTRILPAPEFYRAEEYHQRYFEKHNVPGCHLPFA